MRFIHARVLLDLTMMDFSVGLHESRSASRTTKALRCTVFQLNPVDTHLSMSILELYLQIEFVPFCFTPIFFKRNMIVYHHEGKIGGVELVYVHLWRDPSITSICLKKKRTIKVVSYKEKKIFEQHTNAVYIGFSRCKKNEEKKTKKKRPTERKMRQLHNPLNGLHIEK